MSRCIHSVAHRSCLCLRKDQAFVLSWKGDSGKRSGVLHPAEQRASGVHAALTMLLVAEFVKTQLPRTVTLLPNEVASNNSSYDAVRRTKSG